LSYGQLVAAEGLEPSIPASEADVIFELVN